MYPNSSLYKDKEELEALQLGSVQLLAPSISKFGPLGVKEFDIFDLPFLMSDDAHARQMMASPMMADLDKKLEAKGVSPLAYWDNGAHVYTCNKPLIMPDDFRGLKMRIQGSKVLEAVARELGAMPQIMRVRRALSGAANRRRRRRGQRAVQHLDAKILRGAAISHGVPPRPAHLCARDQQEVLEFAAAGRARTTRSRREGDHRVLQRYGREGQCRRDGKNQSVRQDPRCTY